MAGPEGMDPAPEQAASNPSQFERLRRRREAIGQKRTVDLPIPGYNGELVATYKLLSWEIIRSILRRMERNKGAGDRRELNAQVETLVMACEEIRFRDPNNGGQLKPLIEDETVRYDAKLAEVLGFEFVRPQHCLLETFGNDFAVSVHHGELIEWMQGSNEEADEEFVGESVGPQN